MRRIYDGKEVINGVVFIKEKKDFDSIINMVQYIKKSCYTKGMCLEYCFLDDSSEDDIYRETFKLFMMELESMDIRLIVIRSLEDISCKSDEREAFLKVMNDEGVGVYLFNEGCFATVNYNEC